jgi:ribosomal protein L37E
MNRYPCPNCGRHWLTEDSSECTFCGWTDGVMSAWWWVAVGAFATALIVWAVVAVAT